MRRASKKKRVSLLPPLATDPQGLFHCNDCGQRCDAKNPCTPCANLDGGSDCVYEQNPVTKRIRKKLPPAVQPFLFSFNSESSPQDSSSSWPDNEISSLSTLDIPSSDIGGSSFSSANTNSSHASPESSHSPQSDRSDSPISQERSTPETQLVPFREESPKLHKPQLTTTIMSSFPPYLKFPSIPRQLHIPLYYSGPERFQVSDTTSSELDLSVCAFLSFGHSTQASQGLTIFGQPPGGATTIEKARNLSHRSQAKRYNVRRYFKHRRSSILYPRNGWTRGQFLCRHQTPTDSDPTARKTRTTGFSTNCRNRRGK